MIIEKYQRSGLARRDSISRTQKPARAIRLLGIKFARRRWMRWMSSGSGARLIYLLRRFSLANNARHQPGTPLSLPSGHMAQSARVMAEVPVAGFKTLRTLETSARSPIQNSRSGILTKPASNMPPSGHGLPVPPRIRSSAILPAQIQAGKVVATVGTLRNVTGLSEHDGHSQTIRFTRSRLIENRLFHSEIIIPSRRKLQSSSSSLENRRPVARLLPSPEVPGVAGSETFAANRPGRRTVMSPGNAAYDEIASSSERSPRPAFARQSNVSTGHRLESPGYIALPGIRGQAAVPNRPSSGTIGAAPHQTMASLPALKKQQPVPGIRHSRPVPLIEGAERLVRPQNSAAIETESVPSTLIPADTLFLKSRQRFDAAMRSKPVNPGGSMSPGNPAPTRSLAADPRRFDTAMSNVARQPLIRPTRRTNASSFTTDSTLHREEPVVPHPSFTHSETKIGLPLRQGLRSHIITPARSVKSAPREGLDKEPLNTRSTRHSAPAPLLMPATKFAGSKRGLTPKPGDPQILTEDSSVTSPAAPGLVHVISRSAAGARTTSPNDKMDYEGLTEQPETIPSRSSELGRNKSSANPIAELISSPQQLQAISHRVYDLIVDRIRREKERSGR